MIKITKMSKETRRGEGMGKREHGAGNKGHKRPAGSHLQEKQKQNKAQDSKSGRETTTCVSSVYHFPLCIIATPVNHCTDPKHK